MVKQTVSNHIEYYPATKTHLDMPNNKFPNLDFQNLIALKEIFRNVSFDNN